MSNESHQTLKRQWTMLRAIPRWPQSVDVNAIVQHLRDAGYTVTRRTVARDLLELSAYLPLFVDNRRRPFRWSWAKEANFAFTPRLTGSQSLALVVLRKHAAQLIPKTMLDDLAPVFDAAERELARTGWKDWPERIAVVPPSFVLLPPKHNPRVLAEVHAATMRRRVLVANYRKKTAAAPEVMRAHPLGLVHRGPVQYLVCNVEGREGIRTLVLHRMSKTSVDAIACEEPKDFRLSEYADGLAIDPRGPVRLRLRFYEHAGAHVRETRLSEDQKCTEISDGVLEISATRQHDDQLEWWLMQFGSRVEVLKPLALRRKIAEEHAKAAAMYKR